MNSPMKSLPLPAYGFLAVVLLACAISALSGSNTDSHAGEPKPILEFSKGQRIAAGELSAGVCDISFDVLNTSGDTLHIPEVRASCGCMDIEFDGSEIPKGESRECRVSLAVKPGARQDVAVYFDVSSPYTTRKAVFIEYQGVQEDQLEFDPLPEAGLLDPINASVITLSCTWRRAGELEPGPTGSSSVLVGQPPLGQGPPIRWKIRGGAGLTFVSQAETKISETSLRSVARFRADPADRGLVWAWVKIEAGSPCRAQAQIKIELPVQPSVRLKPSTVLVSRRSPVSSETLASVSVISHGDWILQDVVGPEWIGIGRTPRGFLLSQLGEPEQQRGVQHVLATVKNSSGQSMVRKVRIVIDLEDKE